MAERIPFSVGVITHPGRTVLRVGRDPHQIKVRKRIQKWAEPTVLVHQEVK